MNWDEMELVLGASERRRAQDVCFCEQLAGGECADNDCGGNEGELSESLSNIALFHGKAGLREWVKARRSATGKILLASGYAICRVVAESGRCSRTI
jgi:hypothetical protein